MTWLGLIACFIVGLLTFVKGIYPPLWKDLLTLKNMVPYMRNLKKAYKKRELIIDRFEQHSKSTPDKVFLRFKEESYTYKQADQLANKAARVLIDNGIGYGDTLVLIMSNEPAFVWIYLASQKIGARLAMINHYLLSESLQRCVEVCDPKMIIVGDGLTDYLPSIVVPQLVTLEAKVPIYTHNPCRKGMGLPCFSELMQEASTDDIDPSLRSKVKLMDASVYIFTSGTTGLPKPAIITHKRAILCSLTYAPIGFSSKDIMYLTLPLYHASAMNLALLNVIQEGACVVLKDKFTASTFWQDCVHYEVTIVQYIGELFRYLTNRPECPEEKQHKILNIVGNGMRLDVWRLVKDRFKIKHIREFYGGTEVPAGVSNQFGQEGSVGRLSPLLSLLTGNILVDLDENTQQPYRDAKGRCRRTKPGNKGVFIVRLSEKVTFEGYLGPASLSSSRILRDVLREGDSYLNTSDLFLLDHEYNLYFKDRLGDSFRWKGENVSTTEVSNILNSAEFIHDSNIYGVPVPGCEGKAGMAAISLKDGYDLDSAKIDELAQLCRDKLPDFARPRFLRVQRQCTLSSTFKQLKVELVKEGFNVATIKDDPLYYLDRKDDKFLPLDVSKQEEIISGDIRL